MSRTAIIVEPNGKGHRFEYVRQVADALQQKGTAVELWTRQSSVRSAEFKTHIAGCRDLRVVVGSNSDYLLFPRVLWAARRGCLIDLDADKRVGWYIAAWIFRVRSYVLMMRPLTQKVTPASVVKSILWKSLTRINRVTTMALGDCFGDIGPRTRSAVDHVIADVPILHAKAVPQVRNNLHVPKSIVLLVAGFLDERKAVLQLLQACQTRPQFHLRLIGTLRDSVRQQVLDAADLGRSVSYVEGFVSDRDLDDEISHADAVSVVLGSPTGSSGIFGRAIAYGRPVIGGGNETVSRAVAARILGPVATSLSPSDIGLALDDLVRNWSVFASNSWAASDRMRVRRSVGSEIVSLMS